jgi:hypothetical protein
MDNQETNFVERTDWDHSIRFYKFANDMERVNMAQESISKCKDHTNDIRKNKAFERAEYKSLIAFFHENRKNISVLRHGRKYFGIWKVSDTESRLVMCVRNPDDEPNWKYMKSLMASRFQDPKMYDVITTQSSNSIFLKHFIDNWYL